MNEDVHVDKDDKCIKQTMNNTVPELMMKIIVTMMQMTYREMGEMFEQCDMYDVFVCSSNESKVDDNDWFVDLNVQGKPLSLEIDTGAKH